jgi:hypothetical protein
MQAIEAATLHRRTTTMHPVRRGLKPLTIATVVAGLSTAVAFAPAASASTTQQGCKPGSVTTATATDAQATHTFVCDAQRTRIEVAGRVATPEQDGIDAPTGGATLHARRAKRQARCAAGDHSARPGGTLVTLTTVLDATGHTTSTRSTAYICGADGAWRQIASPMAGVTLISTSLVIERTETTR